MGGDNNLAMLFMLIDDLRALPWFFAALPGWKRSGPRLCRRVGESASDIALCQAYTLALPERYIWTSYLFCLIHHFQRLGKFAKNLRQVL